MPRRKLSERNVRNIQRSKGTYYITVPIEHMRELGWKERQKVVVERDGERLIVKDWKR